MNSRERLIAALEHRLPDRVPYDLAGSHVTGIHSVACRNLCRHLGVEMVRDDFSDVIQQIVVPPEPLLERLEVDTRGLFPLCSHNWNVRGIDRGDHAEYTDEWGFVHHFPKGGYWWSLVKSPLDTPDLPGGALERYPWPRADLPARISGLRGKAMQFRAQGKIVMLKGLCAGLFEMGQRLRGMENFLCDVLADPRGAGSVLDKFAELKMRFWDMALGALGDVVDIAVENDDYGTQESQLVSPDVFRQLMKPRWREIFALIRRKFRETKPPGERGWIFFHSCGSVRPILPDFIEIGVDILNPVHAKAAGMEPRGLKRDFGREIVFWGGGVDTQEVLPRGTPAAVREDVKRNLEIFMPGGGFVFNTVHNIQADVPPGNIMAMWETLRESGRY